MKETAKAKVVELKKMSCSQKEKASLKKDLLCGASLLLKLTADSELKKAS